MEQTTNDVQAEKNGHAPAIREEKPQLPEVVSHAVMPGFNSASSWDLAQRIGKAFASSSLVPEAYRNNVANCIVALEMANRMGASPLMVMQNLYIVHGNPGWSSKFLIASFNQCGRFSSLRYSWNADKTECTAWCVEKATDTKIEGPPVSMEMAKAEGWSTKNGSKWKNMPQLMLMYRAAAFLIRTYAPEISMGLQTAEEVEDVAVPTPAPARPLRLTPNEMEQAKAAIDAGEETLESILEKVPNLVEDQKEKLRAIIPPNTDN